MFFAQRDLILPVRISLFYPATPSHAGLLGPGTEMGPRTWPVLTELEREEELPASLPFHKRKQGGLQTLGELLQYSCQAFYGPCEPDLPPPGPWRAVLFLAMPSRCIIKATLC